MDKYSASGKKVLIGQRAVLTMKTTAAAKSMTHRLNTLARAIDEGLSVASYVDLAQNFVKESGTKL
jgi:hypothetical protein